MEETEARKKAWKQDNQADEQHVPADPDDEPAAPDPDQEEARGDAPAEEERMEVSEQSPRNNGEEVGPEVPHQGDAGQQEPGGPQFRGAVPDEPGKRDKRQRGEDAEESERIKKMKEDRISQGAKRRIEAAAGVDETADDGKRIKTRSRSASSSSSSSESSSENDSSSSDSETDEEDDMVAPLGQALDEDDKRIICSAIMGVDITEVYSPARITETCRRFRLIPGCALDLQTGWDFSKASDRARALQKIEDEAPLLIVGSPPCTLFSILQEMSKAKRGGDPQWMAAFEKKLEQAKVHVRFCCLLYRMQAQAGRYWLHEHPWLARSWGMPEVQELLRDPRTNLVEAHLCQFGLTTPLKDGSEGTAPAKKPTGFMTNSWLIARALDKRCHDDHLHCELMNGRARQAAIYPRQLCEATCMGLSRQKEHDQTMTTQALNVLQQEEFGKLDTSPHSDTDQEDTFAGRQGGALSHMGAQDRHQPTTPGHRQPKPHWKDTVHEDDGGDDRVGTRPQNGQDIYRHEILGLMRREGFLTAWDDVSGKELDADEVAKARQLEMDYFEGMRVYDRVPRSHQRLTGGKIIGTRWVDVNKGDSANKDYRSRLVGKEFRQGGDDSIYASTPPLEALRAIISYAATHNKGHDGGRRRLKHIMINDVRRAYFYAKAKRDLYIELPPEDTRGSKDQLGKLRLSLYGTRDAASNWQETLASHLVSLGFIRGVGHPCVFVHPDRGIWTMVHGDDYVSAGFSDDLEWLEEKLGQAYEIKTAHLGPNKSGHSEGKVLNRIIRWSANGWELEADPRHAELVIEQLQLQDSKGLTTPSSDDDDHGTEKDKVPLSGADVTMFRGLAARCNYLALDRPDILYASKEICREMAKPVVGSLNKLRRLGRYLKYRPRVVWSFVYQHWPQELHVHADSNWAGCRRTRKSTSGGTIAFGMHTLKCWSRTQSIIAKSSGEAELYGAVCGTCQGLGIRSLYKDFGESVNLKLFLDANAAKGIIERRGLCKVKHIDLDNLWLQEQEMRNIGPIVKVPGTPNPADLMTKALGEKEIIKNLGLLRIQLKQGRASTAANLHQLTHGDSWDCAGKKGIYRRRHQTWRRSLFVPWKTKGGPENKDEVLEVRVTTGKTRDGKRFEITDSWRSPQQAQRVLPFEWQGSTTFYKKSGGGANTRAEQVLLLRQAARAACEGELRTASGRSAC